MSSEDLADKSVWCLVVETWLTNWSGVWCVVVATSLVISTEQKSLGLRSWLARGLNTNERGDKFLSDSKLDG